MRRTISIFTTCFVLILTNHAQAQRFDLWENLQKIKPSVSKKDDLDKLFAKASNDKWLAPDGSENYEFKEGSLSIGISDGVCRKNDWNVPKGIVHSLHFFFTGKKKPVFNDFVKKYEIDLSKFNRTTDPLVHEPDKFLVNYELADRTLRFSTFEGRLQRISMSVPNGYRDPRCNNLLESLEGTGGN